LVFISSSWSCLLSQALGLDRFLVLLVLIMVTSSCSWSWSQVLGLDRGLELCGLSLGLNIVFLLTYLVSTSAIDCLEALHDLSSVDL